MPCVSDVFSSLFHHKIFSWDTFLLTCRWGPFVGRLDMVGPKLRGGNYFGRWENYFGLCEHYFGRWDSYLAGRKIILAGGKFILAGEKIILASSGRNA